MIQPEHFFHDRPGRSAILAQHEVGGGFEHGILFEVRAPRIRGFSSAPAHGAFFGG
jgi:hypothetical protein